MADAVSSKPDVHGMVVAHRGFRHWLGELPDLVRGLRPGDLARARLIVDAVRFVLLAVEVHHLSEDEYLGPRLTARAPGQADAVARMKQEHYRLDDLLAQVTCSLDELAADPRQPLREEVAVQLGELGAVACAHMDEEERTILPLAAEHLGVGEWEELAAASLAKLDGRFLLRAFGALMAVSTPEEQKAFLGKASWPTRFLWRLCGRHMYARWLARLHDRAGEA